MNKILVTSIIFGMIIFSGCGDTGNDGNTTTTCGSNVDMLSGDNPVITLEGDTEIEISLGTTEVLSGDSYCAYDPQDGDLTQYIQRTNNIDFNRAGVYTVTYYVEDSDGYSDTKTRTVTIVDSNNANQQGDSGYYLGEEQGADYDSNPDLGEEIGGNGGGSATIDIDSFIAWYSNTCNGTFDLRLYNETTGSYSGTIDCSNQGLEYIDLTQLGVFSSIDKIDLSKNKLTDIDFSPIKDIQGLNYLLINNNTATLKSKYDTKSERNALFRYFTNLHGGDGKTGLYIGFKPHQDSDVDGDCLTIRI
ncbi:hypothetical protein MNB_SV-12-112 [hydrothermal vent metagenome]|uniref:Pesticidal crystal protein Cry22Aa Ig-like domain-containing protein n=1 Tax=hydrothermal vent metagenome TaxID=652676 RepID=A0A1W1CG51_9ZZZZ